MVLIVLCSVTLYLHIKFCFPVHLSFYIIWVRTLGRGELGVWVPEKAWKQAQTEEAAEICQQRQKELLEAVEGARERIREGLSKHIKTATPPVFTL